MKIFDRVVTGIEANREKKFNCIPFDELFPRFSTYVPGIQKSQYYAITGSPGSAKTQLTDHIFLYHALDFIKNSDIKLDITYFSFEISKESKIRKGICKRLFEKYGIRISPNILQSIGSSRISDEIVEKVKECRDYFEKLEDLVTFYDEPLTPSQIARVMEKKVKENGYIAHKIVEVNGVSERIPDGYVENDPNKYLLFITDHISLIHSEPGHTLHQSLSMFSSNNVYYRNKYRVSIVNVHQQSTEGSVEQFTLKGDNIVSKVEPQLALLGDNRTLGRDYDIVLGMFSPFRYEVGYYRGYHTKKFEDKCRFLSVLKNREGEPDLTIPLYFDGMVNYFEELPKASEFSILKQGVKSENELLYEKYLTGKVGILDRNTQKKFNFL